MLDLYPFDSEEVTTITQQLETLPGLVDAVDIEQLKLDMAGVENKQNIFLQLGQCAEEFASTNFDYVKSQVNLMHAAATILNQNLDLNIIAVARIAGQFGKPRTNNFETIDGKEIINYYGDIINSPGMTSQEREPKPANMLTAYAASKKILHHLDQVKQQMNTTAWQRFYTSHEALLIPYEQALTRTIDGKSYNLSAHFLWLGYRSIHQDSSQINYLKNIENPIGIKVGIKVLASELCELIKLLNPQNQAGKIALIMRLGVNEVASAFSSYVDAVKKNKLNVTWVCDPMHGNTLYHRQRKIRLLNQIKQELTFVADSLYQSQGIYTGIHLECTGSDEINECIPDERFLENHLKQPNTALMDPQLNRQQTIEMIEHYTKCVQAYPANQSRKFETER